MATTTRSHQTAPDQKVHLLFGQELVDFIVKESKQIGLDPAVPLAVVPHEGGFYGAVGDKGSSFGPFQLHRGGALPKQVGGPQEARYFAQSEEGVAYALRGMEAAIVAHPGNKGKGTADSPYTGTTAVHNAVYYFERPGNPAAEDAAVRQTYFKIAKVEGNAAGIESGGTGPWYRYPALGVILGLTAGAAAGAGAGGAIARGAGKAGKAAGSAAGELGNKTGAALVLASLAALFPKYAVRAAEALAGAVLILLGLLTLMRAVTGSATAGVPVPRP